MKHTYLYLILLFAVSISTILLTRKLIPWLSKKAMQFIMSNRQNKITINDIVSAVNVSSAHLSRNFKQITGKTIIEFINTTKCEMAQSLLLSGLSVTEVSNMCGFD